MEAEPLSSDTVLGNLTGAHSAVLDLFTLNGLIPVADWLDLVGSQNVNKQGHDQFDYSYTGQVVMEDVLEDIPIPILEELDSVKGRNTPRDIETQVKRWNT
jgi:hypothetical protein